MGRTALATDAQKIAKLQGELARITRNSSLRVAMNDPDGIPVADGVVTGPKLASEAVDSEHIADGAVTSAKIASLEADKIVAGTGIIANLSIKAVLTIGVDGRIEDADGSKWDKDGMVLAATDVIGDSIAIQRTSYNGSAKWRTAIDTNLTRTILMANWNDASINTRDAGIRGEATNADGTTFGAVECVSTAGQTFQVAVYADARVVLGAVDVANIAINGAGSFGGGTGVIFIANRTGAPSSNPTGGGILYTESGALKYRGSSGTITTVAPA